MTTDEIADYFTTEMTYSFAVLDERGNRSPQKVGRLLERFLEGRRLVDAIRALHNEDPHLCNLLRGLRSWAGKRRDEAAYLKLLERLRDFRDQTGGQRMVPKHDCPRVGRQLSRLLRETLEKAQS